MEDKWRRLLAVAFAGTEMLLALWVPNSARLKTLPRLFACCAGLQGFCKEPGFREFFALVKPFFNDIQEMRHYELRSMHWKRHA